MQLKFVQALLVVYDAIEGFEALPDNGLNETSPVLEPVPSGEVAFLAFHSGVPPVLLRASRQGSWLWVYYFLLISTGIAAMVSASVHRKVRAAFPLSVALLFLLPTFAILHGFAEQMRANAPGFCVFNLSMIFICLAAVPSLYVYAYAASFSSQRPHSRGEVAPAGYVNLPSARGERSPGPARETPRAPEPPSARGLQQPDSARGGGRGSAPSTGRRSSRVAPEAETRGPALEEGFTAIPEGGYTEPGDGGSRAGSPERAPPPLTPRTQYRRTGVEDPTDTCKFFCPICMLFFPAMLRASCCAQYVCETCALAYVKGRNGFPRGAPSHALPERLPAMECPYCAVDGFQILPVDAAEEARKYEDSPGVQHKREAVAQRRASGGGAYCPSPLKIGDSFEALKAKMITFEQAGYRTGPPEPPAPSVPDSARAAPGARTPPPGTPPRAAASLPGAPERVEAGAAGEAGAGTGAGGPLELDSISSSPLMLRRTVSRVASGGGSGPAGGAAAAAALAAAAPPATPAQPQGPGRGAPPPPSPAAAMRAMALAETAGLVVYSMPNVPSNVSPSPSIRRVSRAPPPAPAAPRCNGALPGEAPASAGGAHVVLVGPGMLGQRPGSAGSLYSPLRPVRLAAVVEEEGAPPAAPPGDALHSRRSNASSAGDLPVIAGPSDFSAAPVAAPAASLPPRPRSRTDGVLPPAPRAAHDAASDTNRSRSSGGSAGSRSGSARRQNAAPDLPNAILN
eukprot:tig00000025_g7914.t1